MSIPDIPPTLRLHTTLSHPADPDETGRVLGFRARNPVLGHGALVLKAEELPVVRDSPAVTHYVVPSEQFDDATEHGKHVYILDAHTVYHIDPLVLADAPEHTGTKYGQAVTGRKVPVVDMQSWPRRAAEVSN